MAINEGNSWVYPGETTYRRLRRDLDRVIADDSAYRLLAGMAVEAGGTSVGLPNWLSSQDDGEDKTASVAASVLRKPGDISHLDLSGLSSQDIANVEEVAGGDVVKQEYADQLREFKRQAEENRKEGR